MRNTYDDILKSDDDDGLIWDRIRFGPMTLKQVLISALLIGGFIFAIGNCIDYSRSEVHRAHEELVEGGAPIPR
jgi:hypothetical protein